MAPSPVPDQNAMPETKSLTPATLQINILSFGHKHEPPGKTDLLFDVRFLPNPYYVPELKEKTGLDEAVAAHALHHENGNQFLAHLFALLDFLLPEFARSGRDNLTIAVGCTGGQHRSVAVAEEIYRHLAKGKWPVQVAHRDIYR